MPLFDEIFHLAKTKDASPLTKKINEEKICIDVQKGICTPIIRLAQQGEEDKDQGEIIKPVREVG